MQFLDRSLFTLVHAIHLNMGHRKSPKPLLDFKDPVLLFKKETMVNSWCTSLPFLSNFAFPQPSLQVYIHLQVGSPDTANRTHAACRSRSFFPVVFPKILALLFILAKKDKLHHFQCLYCREEHIVWKTNWPSIVLNIDSFCGYSL